MKQIKDLVSIIQQATIDSADVTRAGRDKVHAGGRTVEEALIALKTISAFAESTLVSAKDITQSTSAQSYSSEQLARSVTEISAVAKQIEQGSKEINSAITGLRQFAESLRSTVAEKARAHYRCSICGKEFCIKHSQIQRNLTVICQDCSVKTKEGFKP